MGGESDNRDGFCGFQYVSKRLDVVVHNFEALRLVLTWIMSLPENHTLLSGIALQSLRGNPSKLNWSP